MQTARFSRALVMAFSLAALWPPSPSRAAAASPDLSGPNAPEGGIWLEELDLSLMATGFGRAAAARTVAGNPIALAGKSFLHGVGTHADAEFNIDLAGGGRRFLADVGIEDDLQCPAAKKAPRPPKVEFAVWMDGKQVATSGSLGFGDKPRRLDVDLRGGRRLRLVVRKLPSTNFNHVTWAGAALVMMPGAAAPRAVPPTDKTVQLPPPPAESPALSAADQARTRAAKAEGSTLWLDELDLSKARVNAGNLWLGGMVSRAPGGAQRMTARKTADGSPIRLGAVTHPRGVASEGENELRIDLGGAARRFVARVGFNTSMSCGKVESAGDALFEVWVDGRPVVQTPHMRGYDRPRDVEVDLRGAKLLVLNATSQGGPVVWAGAFFELDPAARVRPRAVDAPPARPASIARRDPNEVRINGARVVGATPGRPFVFRVAATGRPPLRFDATGLPAGLTLDPATGIVQGAIKSAGTTRAVIKVTAANGRTERPLTIVAGNDKLALTPPMGWNSWNVWGMEVDDAKVRAAADAMVTNGLVAQGYGYVNIDEGWSGVRDARGDITANKKFPDMVALARHVHDKGLRLGIHSSPGPKTCGRNEGSYRHEQQDARTFAAWGIDYLKYDWCSYGSVARDNSLPELQKPYNVMRAALADTQRDVVFSLCQYGLGDVWKWGRDVGGNLWRTGADIVDTWASLSDLGFSHDGRVGQVGPGGWNDPDMMIVGKVGWGSGVHDTRLTPDEQVTHVTLWSILAAPLLLGNDLTRMDEFTLDLLQNPEVIDVDQDSLGRPGSRKAKEGAIEVWARPLFDGTTAVALFNRGQVPARGVARWKDLGLSGEQPVRNLWARKDQGAFKNQVEVDVPGHGAAMLRIGRPTSR